MVSDSLRAVFDDAFLERCTKESGLSGSLHDRFVAVTARGNDRVDSDGRAEMRALRARRAAWEAYLDAAFACGLFNDNDGRDLRARLIDNEEDTFRAAMDECMACWCLAGKMRSRISSRPAGRRGKNLDLLIHHHEGDIAVEVKSPRRDRIQNVYTGDDSDILARCLDDANKQFADNGKNLLVITPHLRRSVYNSRSQLIRAFYGEDVITYAIDTQIGSAVGEPWAEFVPNGSFLSTKRSNGRSWKADQSPRYTRVGGVMCIEEHRKERCPHRVIMACEKVIAEDGAYFDDTEKLEYERRKHLYDSPLNQSWFEHDIIIMHNPHALHPLPQDIWGFSPQLIPCNGEMVWTDNYEDIE